MTRNIIYLSILVLTYLVYPDMTINTSNLDNSTTVMSHGACANITDGTNYILLCAPNISKWNTNVTLSYNETVYNSTLNASFTAPPFPKISISKILNYSEIFSKPEYDLVIVAPPVIYINTTYNITSNNSSCPSTILYEGSNVTIGTGLIECRTLLKNVSKKLDFGDIYNNTNENIVIFSPEFPKVSQRIVLNPGQYASSYETDERFNYSIYCNHSSITSTLETDLTKCMLDKTATQVDNDNLKIKNTDLETSKIKISSELDECLKKPEPILQQSSIQGINASCTSPLQLICPDQILAYCTPDQKLKGDYVGCLNSVMNNTATQTSNLQNQLASVQLSEQQCKEGQKTNSDFLTMMISGLCLIIIIVGGAWVLVDRTKAKRMEEGE